MIPSKCKGLPLLLSLFLLLAACPPDAPAAANGLSETETAYLAQKQTLSFISQSHYPPFEFVGDDGDHTGMCIELVRWIATEFGFKAHFTDTSFKHAQQGVLSGRADVITSLFHSKKRAEQFDFTSVMFEVPAYIFVVAERPDIRDIKDLQGKTIAMQAGDFAQEFLESRKITFTPVFTKDFAEATDLVVAGKADAIIGDEQIVLYHIFSNNLTKQIKKVGEPLYTGKNCMAAKAPNPILVGILNKGIALAKQKGALDQITRKWIGTRYSPIQSWLPAYLPYLLTGAGALFAAAVLVWLWNLKLRQLVNARTAALSASEKTLRTILAALPVGVGLLRGRRLSWHNRAMRRMLGRTSKELEEKDIGEFFRNPLQAEAFSPISSQDLPQHENSIEAQWVREDGTVFDCLLRQAALLPESGEQPCAIVIAEDITVRKKNERERQRLETMLHRAEKMEALGTMAGGVAHDLNNVLGVLVGYSELMLLKTPKGNPLRNHAANILQSGQRGAAIIQDLLTLARRGVAVSEVLQLNKIVADVLETPELEKLKSYHPNVTITTELDPDLLNIEGSPIHLSKTIMNLVSNAAEAIAESGDITVRTKNVHIDKPLAGYENMQLGDYAALLVHDNGNGISDKDLSKIFEPFYTKKVMGRSGTGLGLAVVWGTVKDHKGYIDVVSNDRDGTTFTLYFPATREAATEKASRIPPAQYMGRGESILVVDDVKEQRELAENMLGSLGYRVSSVAGGEQAVAYLQKHKADLLVLDMIMDPGIDGLETYRRILAFNPGQRAVVVSGYSETERVKTVQRLGAGAYIRKPYLMEKIGMAVRKELDRQSTPAG